MIRGMIGICLGTFVGHPQSHLSQITRESNPIHNCYMPAQGFCPAYCKPATDKEETPRRMSDQVAPTALAPGGGSGNAPSSGACSASPVSGNQMLRLLNFPPDKHPIFSKDEIKKLAETEKSHIDMNAKMAKWAVSIDGHWKAHYEQHHGKAPAWGEDANRSRTPYQSVGFRIKVSP